MDGTAAIQTNLLAILRPAHSTALCNFMLRVHKNHLLVA